MKTRNTPPSDASPFLPDVEENLKRTGFARVPHHIMRPALEGLGLQDWDSFAESWNHLGIDRYMADAGRYRRRRYATFAVDQNNITPKPRQPHYQSRDHNVLNGGIERWFKPIAPNVTDHPAMHAAIRAIASLAYDLTPAESRPNTWHAEVHQFRIEALPDTEGRPTPEGMHKDGVDWVLVLMIDRSNVEQGTTTIHDDTHTLLGSFTLTEPLDAAIVDDHRVFHGVTPVTPIDPTQPAHRDVLVITLRHE
ncbi:2OG-Fe dioxygenase family protein [Neokomagataea anthophila]|uniref:2OG-Fe dioxygenase family protein n=1 Tax=Neokomagataea anthophila TaxID=2826925 RepID=A0ABS5E615_9PROT|nr:2OG-Fe dioxygenase family protein [Neokomagataea anthophila]MBR0559345.1 2OG-Fe dioxygenase family protein [Neokomagataea anthophila]